MLTINYPTETSMNPVFAIINSALVIGAENIKPNLEHIIGHEEVSVLSTFPFTAILAGLGALLIASVIVDKYAYRIGIPGALAIFITGLAININHFNLESEGFEQLHLLALSLLLFYSGVTLDKNIFNSKKLLVPSLSLSLVGTSLMVIIGGFLNHFLLKIFLGTTTPEAQLWVIAYGIAYAMAAQDWGAFEFINKRIKDMNGNIRMIFELETAVSAAMTIIIGSAYSAFMIGKLDVVKDSTSSAHVLISGFSTGIVLGALLGYLLAIAIRKFAMEKSQIIIITIGFIFFGYSFAAWLGHGGLVCNLVMGIVLSLSLNQDEDEDGREVLATQLESINIATESLIFFMVGLSLKFDKFILALPIGLGILVIIWLLRPIMIAIFFRKNTLSSGERFILSSWSPKGAISMALAVTIPPLIRQQSSNWETLLNATSASYIMHGICAAVILSMIFKSQLVPIFHSKFVREMKNPEPVSGS